MKLLVKDAARLLSVTIEHRPALEVIDAYDAVDGTMYVDPPYVVTTRSAMHRRPNGDYRCEFATEDEHRQLAEALHRARATIILSGYDSELYDELYADWHRVERRVLLRTSNGRSSENYRAIEVVWSNQRIADGQLDLVGAGMAIANGASRRPVTGGHERSEP